MIPIKHEKEWFKELKQQIPFPEISENCIFCKKPTGFWHTKSNNPVCKDCSKKHKVSELHNYFTGKPYKS